MLDFKKILTLGKPKRRIEVSARVSSRAKRISLRVSSKKGVELIIPKRVRMEKAMEFLLSKEEWILFKISQAPEAIPFDDGFEIPIQGRPYTICHTGKLRGITHLKGNNLMISGPEESAERKVKVFLHELAKKELTARAEIEALKLGVELKLGKVTIRDTTTRWGSCSTTGNLSFSWRLILAPREVLEYVAAHEVSHLLEMNHGKKFWKIVENLYPEHHDARKWLKDNGTMLHMYGA
jgi:predicted metal-dependent hydrolase